MRAEQRLVNLRRDVEIAINRAVAKFDLERAEPFAIADRREGRGFDRDALYPGDNADWFWRGRGVGQKSDRAEEETRRQCNGGTPPHGALFLTKAPPVRRGIISRAAWLLQCQRAE